jgi:hypothetical protein
LQTQQIFRQFHGTMRQALGVIWAFLGQVIGKSGET